MNIRATARVPGRRRVHPGDSAYGHRAAARDADGRLPGHRGTAGLDSLGSRRVLDEAELEALLVAALIRDRICPWCSPMSAVSHRHQRPGASTRGIRRCSATAIRASVTAIIVQPVITGVRKPGTAAGYEPPDDMRQSRAGGR
ncbi:hypothetical protein SVIOM74S_07375 [Streptomyces violarus]